MNSMFQDKRKNIIEIAFTSFYIVTLLFNFDFRLPFFQNLRYTLNSLIIYLIPLVTPVLVLIFLLCKNGEYRAKKYLFPIAFGFKFFIGVIQMIPNLSSIDVFFSNPLPIIMFLCSCLILVANLAIFIGTLFNFRFISLLMYGVIVNAILSLGLLVLDFIQVGGYTYIQSVPDGISPINIGALIRALAHILFCIAIFILTRNKRSAA